jgi:hypothetical protein
MKKIGRPLKVNEKRAYVLNLGFTASEKIELMKGWRESNFSTISDYCRARIFGLTLIKESELKALTK